MIISLLVAMDERRGIGKENRMPWRLPTDLKRFRELTMGHHIVVGRKTFEVIGKPLPGREMIVVTRNEAFKPEGCLIARSVDEAIKLARARGETELFIIGGAQVFEQSLAVADRVYLTLVHARVDADTFFPKLPPGEWVEQESHPYPADEKNQYPFTFKLLTRSAGDKDD